jgi:hypothetical protein
MQSEFTCHLGQGGKFFCRMCMVKGVDSASGECASQISQDIEHVPDPPRSPEPGEGSQADQGTGRVNGTSDESSNEDARSVTRGRRKRQETMQEMVDRVSRFIEVRFLSAAW